MAGNTPKKKANVEKVEGNDPIAPGPFRCSRDRQERERRFYSINPKTGRLCHVCDLCRVCFKMLIEYQGGEA